MAVTAILFTKYLASIHGGLTAAEARKIDILSDDIKVMLTTNVWAPNRDTMQFKSDVTNEVAGAGYVAGGQSLAAKTITVDAATHSVRFDANDPTWAGATFTSRRAVFYNNTPALDADKELIGYIDFGQDEPVAGAEFKIQFAAEGYMKHTAA